MFISRADVLLRQLGASEPEPLVDFEELAEGLGHPTSRSRGRRWPGLSSRYFDYTVAGAGCRGGPSAS
jgi:hypothetical protein